MQEDAHVWRLSLLLLVFLKEKHKQVISGLCIGIDYNPGLSPDPEPKIKNYSNFLNAKVKFRYRYPYFFKQLLSAVSTRNAPDIRPAGYLAG
jgi:hypothetical protein